MAAQSDWQHKNTIQFLVFKQKKSSLLPVMSKMNFGSSTTA